MPYSFENPADVKLILLYLLDSFQIPVPNAYLVDTALDPSFVNYFDLQQALLDSLDCGFVSYYEEDGTRFYSLTKRGTEALSFFREKLPLSVREKLHVTARMKLKELRHALSIIADCKQISELEYESTIGIREAGYDLFRVTLTLGNEATARQICSEFKQNPQGIYAKILNVFLQDKS